jgi:hypothetical protein
MISIETYKNDPEWGSIKEKVITCGGDRPEVFGSVNYGGYLLQQNPIEFASLVYFLKKQGPFNCYVEVGSASGGNLRFIHENVGFHSAFSFDDMMHPHSVHQAGNSWGFGEKLVRYVGDSHRPDASQMFSRWISGRVIDIAFIDGDHSLNGVMQDFAMLRPFMSARSLVIFHDTKSIPDIGIATRTLIESNRINPVAHFVADQNACGIMVATPVS